MRNNKLLLLLISVTLLGCSKNPDANFTNGYKAGYEAGFEEGYNKGFDAGFINDVQTINFDIHTDIQQKYLAGDYTNISPYSKGVEELSRPKPITIDLAKPTNALKVDQYILYLSENKELLNAKEYTTEDSKFEIYNLKIRTRYYYQYVAKDGDKYYYSSLKSIYISTKYIRNLYISGVTNARDMGGYCNIKQGLIYRTARLHSNDTNNITEKGIGQYNELGIKTEIDLRMTSETDLAHGAVTGTQYYAFPMDYSAGKCMIDDSSNKEQVKKTFEVFADSNNYPIVYHCAIGTDRTGVIGFLLNGLLGVNEEILYKDYLFSNFGNIGSSRDTSAIDRYIAFMNASYPNAQSLSEKIEAYLLDIGVTKQEINNLKSNMLEK